MLRNQLFRNRLPVFVHVLLACAFMTGASLAAQTRVGKGWALNADGAVKVFMDGGTLQVVGWDRDSVDVSGTVASDAKFFSGGGGSAVKMGIESNNSKPSGPSDLVLHLPARARISLRTVTADIEVTAFSGALDATSVAGRIRVNGTPAEVRAESMNGGVDMNASPAYLRIKTATGYVNWTGSSDDVGITTVSGRVVINAGTVQRARFESIDGEIRFTGGVARNANVAIDTHSGNVSLAFRKGTNAGLEVSAPGCELFGVKEGAARGAKGASVSITFYRAVGQPGLLGQMFVVRSYKGYVTAVMQ